MEKENNKLPAFERIAAIDNYRGIIIILMNLAGFLSTMAAAPSWLKHPHDVGFSIVDIGAPAFMFAIALNYKASFERKIARSGLGQAYSQTFMRYVSFIGVGAVAVAIQGLYMDIPIAWGVLQAIGFAGVLTLCVIRLKPYIQVSIGAVLLIIYQILLDRLLLDIVLNGSHGGLIGAFSWSAMLIMFVGIVELCKNSKLRLLIAVGVLSVLFVISLFAFRVPVSKVRINSSYVMLTMALSLVCYLLACFLFGKKFIPFISWWGENSMLYYITDMVIIALIIVIVDGFSSYSALPLWSIAIIYPISVALMSAMCYFTHKKGIKVKF